MDGPFLCAIGQVISIQARIFNKSDCRINSVNWDEKEGKIRNGNQEIRSVQLDMGELR